MDSSSQGSMQISTTPALLQLDQLLPLLSSSPYSSSTLSLLAALCTELKLVGPELERSDKDKLDTLQTLLTKICQDRDLDLVLRLQVLEVIELRTLGWKSNEGVDNYYKERFTQFEESRRKEQERKEAKAVRSRDAGVKKIRENQSGSKSSDQEQVDEKDKIFVTVNGVKLFISSTSQELSASAKKFLENHFSNQSMALPTSKMKYTRTDLLTLASSTMAKEAPLNWDKLAKTLPNFVLQKKRRKRGSGPSPNANQVGGGDSSQSLMSKQKISALPENLPIIRNFGM
eukprot:GFUD01022605.1.p1 GENE.GFUD01022605.1~~GFUD01022605.1.p1  ORF type:complete len:287 (-),score=121.78 GFUD01022605.1:95-955(-)